MNTAAYCDECGGKLNLYVAGICPQCHHELTGEAESRDADPARGGLEAPELPAGGLE